MTLTDCCICYEPIVTRITLPCTHEFCVDCIVIAYENKHACPLCRSPVCIPSVDSWESKYEDAGQVIRENVSNSLKLLDELETSSYEIMRLKNRNSMLERVITSMKNTMRTYQDTMGNIRRDLIRIVGSVSVPPSPVSTSLYERFRSTTPLDMLTSLYAGDDDKEETNDAVGQRPGGAVEHSTSLLNPTDEQEDSTLTPEEGQYYFTRYRGNGSWERVSEFYERPW